MNTVSRKEGIEVNKVIFATQHLQFDRGCRVNIREEIRPHMCVTDVLITSLQLTASYKEYAHDDLLINSTSMYMYKEETGGV